MDAEKIPKGITDAQFELIDGNGKHYVFLQE
jgi:hypothetical protein